MRDDGVKNALAFVTSAYSSYSSCRQYLEDIERARESVGPDAPRVEKLRAFYNHPGFIEANVANVRAALEQIPEERRAETQIVFTAHSIPETMAQNCDYEAQLQERPKAFETGPLPGRGPRLGRVRPAGLCSKVAAGRPCNPGWARMFATTCGSCTRAAPKMWLWLRLDLSPTTWRLFTIWIPKPWHSAASLA